MSSVKNMFNNGRFTEHASQLAASPLKDDREL